MMPLAPGLLSITTDCFRSLDMKSASMRPVTSAPEPGACGITSLIGRAGKVCAAAGPPAKTRTTEASEPRSTRREVRMERDPQGVKTSLAQCPQGHLRDISYTQIASCLIEMTPAKPGLSLPPNI